MHSLYHVYPSWWKERERDRERGRERGRERERGAKEQRGREAPKNPDLDKNPDSSVQDMYPVEKVFVIVNFEVKSKKVIRSALFSTELIKQGWTPNETASHVTYGIEPV